MALFDTLKFVKGAVATKNFIPELTHFAIEQGFIRSYNGTLGLCAPIDVDIECMPKATPFVKAIQHCNDTVSLHMTPTGKLCIKSGSFKAYIDCIDNGVCPHGVPEGDVFEFDGEVILDAFDKLLPFVGDDASRPWSNGILLSGQSAFATNNVIIAEHWLSCAIPRPVCIPLKAVKELLRIKEIPIAAQADASSITFHFNDKRWIRTNLLDTKWPLDTINKILNTETVPVDFPEGFFDGIEGMKEFTDKLERIYFRPNAICTAIEKEEGASLKIDGFSYEGVYAASMLLKLKKVATKIDFSTYPNPCIFYGDMLRGAIIGLRV